MIRLRRQRITVRTIKTDSGRLFVKIRDLYQQHPKPDWCQDAEMTLAHLTEFDGVLTHVDEMEKILFEAMLEISALVPDLNQEVERQASDQS